MRYAGSSSTKAWVGLGLIFGLGAGLSTVHLLHVVDEGENLWTFVYGIIIPLVFSVSLVLAGLWLWRRGIDGDGILRIGAWSLLGAVALTIGGTLTILHEQAEGLPVGEPVFIIADQASLGGLVGLVVGYYDWRRRAVMARSERLTEQMSVLNRVLRHDIRNDANVIQGRIDLIRDEYTDLEDLDIISRKAGNLVALGDHARIVERVMRNEFEPASVDIRESLGTQIEELRETEPELTIVTDLLSVGSVRAHPLIDTAIRNVLENAVEHNDSEDPRIEIGCTSASEDGLTYVEIRIADNGPGIPKTEIETLERGYETPLEHTSGLGLWLINWIVRESGGEIRFEENEPRGSVVCIRLRRVTE